MSLATLDSLAPGFGALPASDPGPVPIPLADPPILVPFWDGLFGDRILFYDLVAGQNSGGGQIKSFNLVGGPIRCRVKFDSSRIKEMGEYESTINTYEIAFRGPDRPPDIQPLDQVAWLAPDGTEYARLTVTSAPKPRDPGPRLWVASAVTVE